MTVRDVHILYAENHGTRGSVLMRGLQLADIAQEHLGERYRFHTRPLPREKTGRQPEHVSDLHDSIIILQKKIIQFLDPQVFALLKRKNIAVMADWIDKRVMSPHLDGIDVHIASSRAQEAHLRDLFPNAAVRHLTHHADPRLANMPAAQNDHFAAVYFGQPGNTFIPPAIQRDLTIFDVRTSEAFLEAQARLPEFGLHYAVRTGATPEGVFKPFTKGFTAAACGANVLIQRDAHDAIHYLGEDYPFLLADGRRPTVREGFFRVRDAFGGPEWTRARDVMRRIKEQSSPAFVAAELGAILDEVSR